MNEKKSAAYCKLIENVKNKYRKNPIYTKNLTLGWCDLRQGEDLCQEINLWTYWQGRDYAKKTPHIKYMLIGQDFGPPEKEELKGTIANVRKMNDGVEVMFHKNVDLEARDSQTDKNIVRYFELLGKNEIDKKKYPDLFFCNCNLGYRRDKYSGNMTRKILANDAAEIKSLIDIIEPENIICLGLDTSVVVIRTLLDKKYKPFWLYLTVVNEIKRPEFLRSLKDLHLFNKHNTLDFLRCQFIHLIYFTSSLFHQFFQLLLCALICIASPVHLLLLYRCGQS